MDGHGDFRAGSLVNKHHKVVFHLEAQSPPVLQGVADGANHTLTPCYLLYKGLSELDAKTIISLQAQNEAQEKQMEAQEKQIQALEKKVARCEGVISTIRYTLKDRRRLRLEVKDDFVMLVDERTGAEITVPIHTGPLSKEEKEDRP